jgi:hypothetical protein
MKNEVILNQRWTGVVKSVVRENKPQSAIIGFLDRDASTTLPIVTLTIERSDGKTIIKGYKLKKDQDHYADALAAYYSAGTVVHCYKGKKYLKKESNIIQINNIAHRMCIACGNFDDLKRTECRNCESTFMD